MSNFENIEAYTEGWMNEPERAAFELELQTNTQLKQDYEDWLQTHAILNNNLSNPANIDQLKQILEPLTQEHFKPVTRQPAKVISVKKYIWTALAAAAIFIIYLALPSGIENYEVPDMPQAVVRGSEALSNKGAQLFNEGRYEDAAPLLKEQALSKPDDATAHFFYGVSLVKTKQYQEAIAILEPLSNGVSVYKEDAGFFAALSAVKLGKQTAAIAYAEKVGKTNANYPQARKIIKKYR